jgi:hypothetical protein
MCVDAEGGGGIRVAEAFAHCSHRDAGLEEVGGDVVTEVVETDAREADLIAQRMKRPVAPESGRRSSLPSGSRANAYAFGDRSTSLAWARSCTRRRCSRNPPTIAVRKVPPDELALDDVCGARGRLGDGAGALRGGQPGGR